jgi:hypothetical protein
MANKKNSWSAWKAQLPKNWIQEVQKIIAEDGFQITIQQIRDTRYGYITDAAKQELVWKAIRKLRRLHLSRQKKLAKLKRIK